MKSEFIFNADGIGNHCHGASIAEHNKSVFCVWYGYSEKEYEGGQICLAQYDSKTEKWTKGRSIFPNLAGSNCGNPIIYSDKKNKILNIYFVILAKHYWDSAKIYHSYSNDDGENWSPPIPLNTDEGIMIRHRPYELDENTILIPAYDEKSNVSIIYKSRFPFDKWELYTKIDGNFIQGDMIAFNENELQIYLRPALDTPLYIYRALSPDKGKTFSTIIKTSLFSPLSGVAAIKLKNKGVLVCHNHTDKFKRTPLTLSYVKDKEVVYNQLVNLEESDMEFSYPQMIELENSEIHIVYTYNRKMIKHVKLSNNFRSEHVL